MANCCLNTIRIEGPEADLLLLKQRINAVRKEKNKKGWDLYRLLLRLGVQEETAAAADCRDDFTGGDATIEDGVLHLDTESAWSFADEGWELLRTMFPEIDVYYLAEEPANGVFVTNDIARKYFKSIYYLDFSEDGEESQTEYFDDEKSLVDYVRDNFDNSVSTFRQARQALTDFSNSGRDSYAELLTISYDNESNLIH